MSKRAGEKKKKKKKREKRKEGKYLRSFQSSSRSSKFVKSGGIGNHVFFRISTTECNEEFKFRRVIRDAERIFRLLIYCTCFESTCFKSPGRTKN